MTPHTSPQPLHTLLSPSQPRFTLPLCPTPLHPSASTSLLPAELAQLSLQRRVTSINSLSPPGSHSAFTASYHPPAPATAPYTATTTTAATTAAANMRTKRSHSTSNAAPCRNRAADKQKNRLARKAELARLSRSKKKVHMAGIMEELESLRRLVAQLKDANARGVKWIAPLAEPADGGKENSEAAQLKMEEDSDESEYDSDSVNGAVLDDGQRGSGYRRASVTSGSSLSSSTTPTFRSRDRHSENKHSRRRRSKRRYVSDSGSDSTSDSSDDSDTYERRRKHKQLKKIKSPPNPPPPQPVNTAPVTTPTGTSPIITLQTISLEALDLVNNNIQQLPQPILHRLLLSLPLHTTTLAALRQHLLAQGCHYAADGYLFVVGGRIVGGVGGDSENVSLASCGVVGDGTVQLVHRALLGNVAVGGMTVSAVDAGVASAEEEAARAISTLAVAAPVV